MNRLGLIVLLLTGMASTSGCTKFKDQLIGAPKEKVVDRYVNVYEDDGQILSDHFVVADSRLSNAGISVIVELCTVDNACLPLPFRNDVAGITVTYLRQGSFLSIYNAQSGLPQMVSYRIQLIDGLQGVK